MFTLRSDGLLILKNQEFRTDLELIEFARRFSSVRGDLKEEILHWDFGPLMDMKHDEKAQNYLYSNEEVPFHWDGAFYKEPRILLFYCTESEGEGGETLFANTEKIWEMMTPDERRDARCVKLTYATEKKAHYGGEITLPMVQTHPVTGKTILRFAEEVTTELNPVSLKISGLEQAASFYQRIKDILYRDCLVHQWSRGDLILCDNFTFLHGRKKLGQNLKRRFKRLQIL